MQMKTQLWSTLSAVIQRLSFRGSLARRIRPRRLQDNLDDPRLGRLVAPLSLSTPHQVIQELDRRGGSQILLSGEWQTAINARLAENQVNEVLSELANSVAAALEAHRRGRLPVSLPVAARGLATVSMSSFVPGSDVLRKDLSNILSARPESAGLISRYRTVILSGDTATIDAVDRRISRDRTWGCWAEVFSREAAEALRPQQPILQWEFRESPMADSQVSSIRCWLFKGRCK